MSKGDRTTRYFPTLPPENTPLSQWMYNELLRLAAWNDNPVVSQIKFEPRAVEPDKGRIGDVAYATTDWKAGAAGLYVCTATTPTWEKTN